MAIDPNNANGAADALTPPGSGEYAAPDAAELERLRTELSRVEGELDEVTEERDQLQREVYQYEREAATQTAVDRRQGAALAHARAVLESITTEDAFTRTMNERAVDAISELLGDR